MAKGVLEVHLVDAKGLSGADFLGKLDPYVLVQYRSQERQTSVARDQGKNPKWNETLKFQINSLGANVQHKVVLRIMDHDNFSSDDFLGEATIDVTDLIATGMEQGTAEQHVSKYSVVLADRSYCGEISVGLTFTAAKIEQEEEQIGGWSQSLRE